MTMSSNFVSSQFLANSLILPITQAQSVLTTAMTEETTGQYADLGLQLGDQSGYELSLKEQVSLIQTLTSGNSLVSTNLTTAQNALSAIGTSAQTAMSALTVWTPSANSGATLQTTGQSALQALIASTNATSGDQYVFGGINFVRRADGRLLFDPDVSRQDRGRPGVPDGFRRPAERPGRCEHFGLGHAEFSRRSVRSAVFRRRMDVGLVVGVEHEHER